MRITRGAAGAAAFALAGALGGALLGGGLAGSLGAQDRPESLLPPGFDDPAPSPSPAPAPTGPSTAAPRPAPAPPAAPQTAPRLAEPDGDAEPVRLPDELPPVPSMSPDQLAGLPTLAELEELSPDELDELLGLKPKFDIPPAARRSLAEVGVIAPSEGGFRTASMARQPAALVRAMLAGTRTPLVSRWGHILMRRALASRLAAPEGMDPVEFAALRAGVLNRMGEHMAARAIAQDVDTTNWDASLTNEALAAYVALTDFTGACPAIRLQGSAREDAQWVLWQAICNAYAGEAALAASQLDRALNQGIAPRIDVLLARRYAGAAGRGRRAVEIEWDEVEDLNPWRFGLATALGEPVPERLLAEASPFYALAGAPAPQLSPAERLGYASQAAAAGVFSADAMVNLLSQVYADTAIGGEPAARAGALREAYVAPAPEDRIAAMRRLWGDGDVPDYGALVATAYAAARVPASGALADAAGDLIASMLTAGLDRDAAAWRDAVAEGSVGWALVALADPDGGAASESAVDAFVDEYESAAPRKAAFLVAGLAGLGRIDEGERDSFAARLDVDLSRQSRWTRTIARAADFDNAALVAMLAGLGMQGADWSQMTPLHLYHIVASLNRVGLEAEARMIAAEAVARG
ncbi:hypothetical protein Ga0102493_112749 [Erythrobacter litoralis]|uniref:Antifreeze glycopeptide polyprotein n=1 Tax=Erythrobacter litoralis TaxID=39960 RepID=A0A074NLW4_9SPHN|nr:hypothetical protein [Erythrobacter litoralis]AOL23754.1 hypothetical protein Ga0102493_112749 [Erythrobacter litoralis]KEO98762.1 hypothetical protein EH32_06550 [Erythrobacter litoralis]